MFIHCFVRGDLDRQMLTQMIFILATSNTNNLIVSFLSVFLFLFVSFLLALLQEDPEREADTNLHLTHHLVVAEV